LITVKDGWNRHRHLRRQGANNVTDITPRCTGCGEEKAWVECNQCEDGAEEVLKVVRELLTEIARAA
jgi:hypothetical protein